MSNDFMSTCSEKDVLTHLASVCSVCGQTHSTNDCSFLHNVRYVPDAPVVSRARQTLPNNLEIVNMADGSTTVITKIDLPAGTSFGPFHSRRTSTMNPLSEFPIKVFGHTTSETYYLDFSNENYSNWMCFITPASNSEEQNLICYQIEQDIFYTAMRIISAGEEIRVWYAPYYAFKMKMPLHNKNFAVYNNTMFSEIEQLAINIIPVVKQNNRDQAALLDKEITEKLANKLPARHLGATNDIGIWNCKFCLLTTKSVVSYAKHLMEHYKPLLGIFCNICNKKCNNTSVLKRHKKAKHAQLNEKDIPRSGIKETQYNNSEEACPLKASDSESQEHKTDKKVTDNILQVCSFSHDKEHIVFDRDLENVDDLLHNDRCLNISLGLNTISESIIPDNMVNPVKFDMDKLVPEILDTMNEKLTNFDCNICDKKFDKVDYLYRHLRKHTGEFICPACLIVFARKENLLSHACHSKHLEYNYECSFCQKLFMQKKYLKRHMAKHNEDYNCKWCHNVFTSASERSAHKCVAQFYACEQCNKRFVYKAHFNRHMKLHNNPKSTRKKVKKRKEDIATAICEKCGDTFRNSYTLKQHLYTHGERMFECEICHSRFHRMAVLKEHKAVHQSAQVPCKVCGKKLKSKKALDIHMLLHGNKKHQCEKCDKSFFQKCNYLKHYKHTHDDKLIYNCTDCSMVFTNKQTFDKHMVHHVKHAQYSCELCKKLFRKEYQLKRHVQTSHSGIIYRCPFCDMTARHRHSMRRHFERQHNTLRQDWDKIGFVNQLAEKSPQFIIQETSIQQHYSLEQSYLDSGPNDLKYIRDEEESTKLCSAPCEDKVTQCLQEESHKRSINGHATLQNEQVITLLQSSQDEQLEEAKRTEVPTNEVPQINMNEGSGNVSETVLDSAYVYDDDGGDIMFYVLQ